MRNILRLRVLGILLLALGLFGGTAVSASAQTAGTPEPTDIGSIALSAFLSDQVAVPTLVEGSTMAATDDEGVKGAVATFSLYINGDTESDPWATVTTNHGDAQILDGVPAGDHLLTLDEAEGYDTNLTYAWTVTVTNGSATVLTVLIPQGDTPGISDQGSLVLSSYAAEQVVTPQFLVSDPINIGPQAPGEEDAVIATGDQDIPYAGAYVVDREFLVYINGDMSSIPTSIQTSGGTAYLDGLPEGTHTLVDAQSEYSTTFDIAQGSVTSVVAVFPEGFGNTGDDDDPDTDDPGNGHHHGNGDDDDDNGNGGNNGGNGGDKDVTKLPSTGQTGNGSDSSTIVMILGAMSLVALAGGFAWRQRRSA